MKKEEFEQDIMKVLKKYGYKIEGMKQLYLQCSKDEVPEIRIEYYII